MAPVCVSVDFLLKLITMQGKLLCHCYAGPNWKYNMLEIALKPSRHNHFKCLITNTLSFCIVLDKHRLKSLL